MSGTEEPATHPLLVSPNCVATPAGGSGKRKASGRGSRELELLWNEISNRPPSFDSRRGLSALGHQYVAPETECGGDLERISARYGGKYEAAHYAEDSMTVPPDEMRRRVACALAVAEEKLNRTVSSVLDVGCGPALWCEPLKEARPGVTYVGLEPSKAMVAKYGQSRNVHRGGLADLAALRTIGGVEMFDAIVCADVMHYVEDKAIKAGAMGIAKHLNDLGVAFIYVFAKDDDQGSKGDDAHFRARTRREYHALLLEGGLRPIGEHWYMKATVDEVSDLKADYALPGRFARLERELEALKKGAKEREAVCEARIRNLQRELAEARALLPGGVQGVGCADDDHSGTRGGGSSSSRPSSGSTSPATGTDSSRGARSTGSAGGKRRRRSSAAPAAFASKVESTPDRKPSETGLNAVIHPSISIDGGGADGTGASTPAGNAPLNASVIAALRTCCESIGSADGTADGLEADAADAAAAAAEGRLGAPASASDSGPGTDPDDAAGQGHDTGAGPDPRSRSGSDLSSLEDIAVQLDNLDEATTEGSGSSSGSSSDHGSDRGSDIVKRVRR